MAVNESKIDIFSDISAKNLFSNIRESPISRTASVLKLYRPPDGCGDSRCSSDMWELVYCVGVPAAVVLLIVTVLVRVMCCKSCRCCDNKKGSGITDDMQMETYNSIRRASATVRLMSYNRETAMLGDRSGSMTLDRSYRRSQRVRDSCNSAPSTLPRQHRNRHAERNSSMEPPAYSAATANDAGALQSRLRNLECDQPTPPPPPPYSNHTDDVFYNPDFLGSDKKAQRPIVRYEETPHHAQSNGLPLPSHPY